jgi:NADH dehydrogenase [ubiquinone] 1 alpha subcomplex assembly factor 3
VQVTSVAEDGIHLLDGLKIPGPCVFLEGKVFLWNAPEVKGVGKEAWNEWNEGHFELLDTVIPTPGTFLVVATTSHD